MVTQPKRKRENNTTAEKALRVVLQQTAIGGNHTKTRARTNMTPQDALRLAKTNPRMFSGEGRAIRNVLAATKNLRTAVRIGNVAGVHNALRRHADTRAGSIFAAFSGTNTIEALRRHDSTRWVSFFSDVFFQCPNDKLLETVEVMLRAGSHPSPRDMETFIHSAMLRDDMDPLVFNAVLQRLTPYLKFIPKNVFGSTTQISQWTHDKRHGIVVRIVVITESLKKHGILVNINARFQGLMTALHMAVEWRFLDIVPELLRLGANVNSKDIERMTPLNYACRNGDGEMIQFLLNHGAIPTVNPQFRKQDLYVYLTHFNEESADECSMVRGIIIRFCTFTHVKVPPLVLLVKKFSTAADKGAMLEAIENLIAHKANQDGAWSYVKRHITATNNHSRALKNMLSP